MKFLLAIIAALAAAATPGAADARRGVTPRAALAVHELARCLFVAEPDRVRSVLTMSPSDARYASTFQHLIERNAKKAAFLREALRITSAPGVVHLSEIGDIVDRFAGPVDCVTARALAPLHQLIGFAEPLVRKGAKALFLKGQDVEAELTEATKYWNIVPKLHSSRSGGQGWIVELDHLERRNS